MDETFDEWVQNDAQQPCVRKWADALIDLGTSWDSFRRDDASIVQDLVDAGGIPLLAARDIVKIAKEEIEKGNAPMAIFWDLENMPIPSSKSGRDVTSRLKFILAPYGNLVQFRGYASIGLNLIPQQKRSDLQLSGCHLVDCPHNGRKEVADKMIIVDAMQFAFMNPKGATLCFITGDVDYAYTLAVLQRPCWRTIVISKGTIRSMLHVNCDMRMRWETDILQLRPSTHDTNSNDNDNNNGSTNTNFATSNSNTSSNNTQDSSDVDLHSSSKKRGLQKKGSRNLDPTTEQTSTKKSRDVRIVSLPQLDDQVQDDVGDTQEDANDNLNCNGVVLTPLLPPTTTISAPSANKSYSYVTATGHQQQQTPKSSQRFEPLSPIEEWTDDVELLRSLLQANGNVGFKCTIGNLLRTTNPARFTNRSSVRNFLAQSIEAGVVVESGEGHYKELSLPDTIATITTTTGANRISVSKSIPLEMLNAVPERVVEVSARRPYVLFVPKKMLSSRFTNPKGAFVKESRGRWLILMFLSFLDVQKAVEELPQLTDCTLVDWRNCQSLDDGEACGSCCRCLKQLLESEIIYKTTKTKSCGGAGPSAVEFEEHAYCVDCYEWNTQDGERGKAADRVVAMLTMMAEHDDIYVARKLLKKQLFSRYTDTGLCTTHKHAELWIDEAIRADQVVPLKKEGQKKILVCLTSNLQLANSDTATDDQDGRETSLSTSKELKHVEDLLLRQVDLSHQWISRKVINASLQATFPRMDTPFMRAKVFQNGYALKRFCIARGHFGQTVGVTEQDAQESLERMNKTTIEELEWNLENGSSGGSSKGDGDGGGGAPKAPDDMKPNDDANDHSITPLVDNESTVAGGYKDTATTESIEHVVIVVAGNVTNDKDKVDIVGDPDDSSKSDVLSEWDGESMNSADIDALLFGRSKIDASKKIIEGEGLCQQDDFIIPDKVDGPLS